MNSKIVLLSSISLTLFALLVIVAVANLSVENTRARSVVTQTPCTNPSRGDLNCSDIIQISDIYIPFANSGARISLPTTVPDFSSPVETPTPPPTGERWMPTDDVPIHWQWQIGTEFNYPSHLLPNVTVYDIDGFSTSASTVSSLHSHGYKVICYISAGTWEDWRPDASDFPMNVKGNTNGWPGERWLDIRSPLVREIMKARLDMCQTKGFDAVEPDNVDGYTNSTGFPLTAADQLDYNRFLATEVHARGMSVVLKNNVEQVSQLVDDFDIALNEECYQYNECSAYSVFVNANKAVFITEYSSVTSHCSNANSNHFNLMRRDLDLTVNGVRTPCIPDTQNSW